VEHLRDLNKEFNSIVQDIEIRRPSGQYDKAGKGSKGL